MVMIHTRMVLMKKGKCMIIYVIFLNRNTDFQNKICVVSEIHPR